MGRVEFEAKAALRTLALAYLVVVTSNSLVIGVSKSRTKVQHILKDISSSPAIKTSLFPALFPLTYRTTASLLDSSSSSPGPVIVSAPLLLLLSPGLRTQIALYLGSTALLHSGKEFRWRKYLPPVWTLNVLGNSWLLWAFLYEHDIFPRSYSNVIVNHSSEYVPDRAKLEEQLSFLLTTDYPPCDPHSAPPGTHANHTRLVCAHLHPSDPSCLSTYLRSWVNESARVWRWVGGFGLLSLVISRRTRLLKDPFLKTFKEWALSTVRGTAFVVGSINTSWALACVFQRIFPRTFIPHSRWILNGAFTSLWILVLPKGRRDTIALYVARLAIQCLYDTYKKKTGRTTQYPEVLVFAVAWSVLLRTRREGGQVRGLVNSAMNFVEGK